MEEQQNQLTVGSGSYNQTALSNQSFMMMRLDTSPLIRDIRKAIGAKESRVVFNKEIGKYTEQLITVGTPLANEEGVMQVCNIVEMFVNQHIAQGNFKDMDHYWECVASFREELAEEVVKKCYDWCILDSDLDGLINKVSLVVELFFTRAIDNKERDSYAQNFQTREVLTQTDKRGGFSSIANGLGKVR